MTERLTELITPQGSHSVSAILFDKDGTLLQFVSLWGHWGESFLGSFNSQLQLQGLAEIGTELLPSLLGTLHGRDGQITDYDRNGALAMGTMADLYAILAWQGYLRGMSWAEAMELVEQCRREADALMELQRPVQPLPGLERFLDECASRGLPLAVVTADETDAAEKHLSWLGIRHYFTAVIGTDLVGRGKPFPDMVQLACGRLGIDPSRAAVIGDTNGDMRMARAAGAAAAIGITGDPAGGVKPHVLQDADVIIHSYEELSLGGEPEPQLDQLNNLKGGNLQMSTHDNGHTGQQPIITFQIITDTHVSEDASHEYNLNFERALQDIAAHGQGSSGIMHIGDVTDHGFPQEYEEMVRIVNKYKAKLPDITFTLGNHDVGLGHWESRLALYEAETGMPGPYHDHWIDGYHFIFLGTEQGLPSFCDLSGQQLQWLEQKLGEQGPGGAVADPRVADEQTVVTHPVFLFLHQPLKDTVAGSLEAQEWYGVTQDQQLRSILAKFPQTLLFTGHTHWELEVDNTMFPGHGRTATMFNASSVAYLWTNEDKHKTGSQGYYVEVYPDRVVVRGRDFMNAAWIDSAQYEVALNLDTMSSSS